MNIVFYFSSFARMGGTERTLTDKMNSLVKMGHSVTMVTSEQGKHPYVFPIDERVRHVDLDCRYFTIYKYHLLKHLLESWKMKRQFKRKWRAFIDQIHPDIVVTTTYSWEFMRAIMSVKADVRIVIESHSAFTYDMLGGSVIRRMRKHSLLRTIKHCDLLTALTKGDAECWKPYVSKVAVVQNPVTVYPQETDSRQKKEGRIIAVGRLNSQKRFDRLIEAFALIADRHPLWYVDIFGEGEENGMLQKMIDDAGLRERVFLRGVTSDIYAEYMRSQFFVLSSDYEGYGLVLLEAMACGVPCVATNCQFGPSDIITDEKDGLLAELNVQDLAKKMEWMIIHETERREMGEKARQTTTKYRKEEVMKEWEKTYLGIL